MHLDNTQLVMATEIKSFIERLKEEGKDYPQIRTACLEKYKDSYWCVTDATRREEAIGAALFAYAMDDEMREQVKKVQEFTGRIFV